MGSKIVSFGHYQPARVLTNDDLAQMVDTNDEWIQSRVGIKERRVAGAEESVEDMAVQAGGKALAASGLSAGDIDLVIVATCTPDQVMPATAATVQDALGVAGGAVDVNAVCSGFVYGLAVGAGMVATGLQRVLLIGADTMSRIVDWDDRGTAILFADGAGAVGLDAVDGPGDLLAYDLDNDGTGRHLLTADIGGTIEMDGREVFRRAVRTTTDSALRTLAKAGVTVDDLALLVPHQANVRIIDAVTQRLGLDPSRAVVTVDHHGNTSAASVPLALGEAADAGRLATGDLVLLIGFGAGMSVASALVRWHEPAIAPGGPGEAGA